MEYLGSCLCKGIKFKVIGDFDSFYLCHCRYCRKDTGSAHAANLFSTKAKLEWIKTETEIKIFQPHKSNHVKAFCTNCGSALPNLQMDGKLLVVPAGCLDTKLEKRDKKRETGLIEKIANRVNKNGLICICIQDTGKKVKILKDTIDRTGLDFEILNDSRLIYNYEDKESGTKYCMYIVKKK